MRWTAKEEYGITAHALREMAAEKEAAGLVAEARELGRMADVTEAQALDAARQSEAQQLAEAREVGLEAGR